MSKWLFIHPRRGLYQLTKCSDCGHTFQCVQCDANLVTYRQSSKSLELLCHQCQSYYEYPTRCPECGSQRIFSRYGGIDELAEMLEKEAEQTVIRLDKQDAKSLGKTAFEQIDNKSSEFQNSPHKSVLVYQRDKHNHLLNSEIIADLVESDVRTSAVTTRVFDPSIDYKKYDTIVFVQAENLLASPDYLVREEVMKSLAEILLLVSEKNRLIFDTNTADIDLFQSLIQLNKDHPDSISVQEWYIKFLDQEKANRQRFNFPPFKNLLLLTTQEKSKEKSLESLEHVERYLKKVAEHIPGTTWSTPYPARFLKRKNLFSHHLLIRFPRQYEHYNQLKKEIMSLADLYRLQVRLNPRHLF